MTLPYSFYIKILFPETFPVCEVCIILQIKYCNIALKLFEINVAIIHSVKKKTGLYQNYFKIDILQKIVQFILRN